VKDSLALLQLDAKVKKALDEGTITVTHARKIARLERAIQVKALDGCFTREFDYDTGKHREVLAPVADLEHWIREKVRLDLTSVEAQEDFPELVAEVNQAAAAGATVLMLADSYRDYGAKPKDGEPLDRYRWDECKQTVKGAQLGVVVEGRRRGKKLWVKLKTQPKAATSTRTTLPKKSAAQREKEQKERQAGERRRAEQKAKEDRKRQVLLRAAVAAGEGLKSLPSSALRLLVQALSVNSDLYDDLDRDLAKALGIPETVLTGGPKTKASIAALSQAQTIQTIVALLVVGDQFDHQSLAATCKAFGVDVKKVDAEIAAEQKAAAKASAPTKKGKAAR
jgi:hypothetical protein